MPRKGYVSTTLPQPLYDALTQEADAGGVTVPVLIARLIDMKRGLRVPLHHNTVDTGILYDLHFFVEVTRRDYRVIRYLSHAYNKPLQTIVQKFIDQF